MSTARHWLLAVATAGLAACQTSAAKPAKPAQARAAEPWRAVLRGKPIERITKVDSLTAKRWLDSLARFAPTDSVARAALAAALYDHPNTQTGMSAAYLLAHSGPPGLEVLLAALGSNRQAPLWRATFGVGEYGVGARSAARRLAFLVRSDDDSVAKMASWALGKAAPKFRDKAVELLRPLRFERGLPQYQAAYQIGWLGPSASFAYPFLIKMLADTNDQARQVASDALRRAGPFARAELEKARLGNNERVRVQAMMILNGLGSE